MFVCYNHKTKHTDWCPIPNDSGWGICLGMWKPVKEVALKILNNGQVYITRSVITRFFPKDRVIMELQCIDLKLWNKSHGPMHYKIGDTCVYIGHGFYTLLE